MLGEGRFLRHPAGMRSGTTQRLLAIALLALGASGGASDIARNALPPPSPAPPRPGPATLFADDFSSASLARWSADRPGVWTVRRGLLRADLPDEKQAYSLLYAGDEAWQDYALEFDVCAMRGVDKGAVVRVRGTDGVGVDLRGPGYQDVVLNRGPIPLGKARVPNANGVWHHVRVEAYGGLYRVFVDDALKIVHRDKANHRPRGRIALAAYTGGTGECTVHYDNVSVTALR